MFRVKHLLSNLLQYLNTASTLLQRGIGAQKAKLPNSILESKTRLWYYLHGKFFLLP